MVEFGRTNRDRVLTTALLLMLAAIGIGACVWRGSALIDEAGISNVPLNQPIGDRSRLVLELVGNLLMFLVPCLILAFIGAEIWGLWDSRVGKRRTAVTWRRKARKASHRRKVAHEGAP